MTKAAVGRRFGENLRGARRLALLSQEELARRAGLHRTEIGLLEHGDRLPRLDTILKLAGGLGVQPGELLHGIRWRAATARPGCFEAGLELPSNDL